MRAAILRRAALALCALLPVSAAALGYSGQLGVRYDRLDTWDASGARASQPLTDLYGNLDARGFVLSPRIFRWNGGVGYDQTRTSYSDGDRSIDALGYNLGFGLFEFRGSRLSLGANAARTTTDYAAGSLAVGQPTGTTVDNVYSVRANVADANRPALSFYGSRLDSTNTGYGREETSRTSSHVGVGLQHGTGPYQFRADYQRRWDEGTLAPANFVSQRVNLNGTAILDRNVTAFVNSQYAQQTPTNEDPLNPTLDFNTATLGAQWRAAGLISSTSYTYSHGLVTAYQTTPQESMGHSVTNYAERTFSPRWSGTGTLGVALNRNRLGTVEERDAGQTAGVTARWSRPATETESAFGIEAGPYFGLLEPSGGATLFGYGGLARGNWIAPTRFAPARYSAHYELDYRNNLFGERGWTLAQGLSGQAGTSLSREFQIQGGLAAGGSRRSTPLFGDNASRSVFANGSLLWRSYAFTLTAMLSDGFGGGLSQSVIGDGLFIPEKYDTHSRSVSAQLSGPLPLRRLTFSALARYTAASGPALPDQTEAALAGTLAYSLGLFQLSVEDRYTVGGATALDTGSNLFLVRLSRSIGGGF